MSRKTLAQLTNAALYLFIYANEKQGKTCLPLTLSADWENYTGDPLKRGKDVGYVTCEPLGPSSCIGMGFKGVVVDVPDALGSQDYKALTNQYISAINSMAMDPNIKVIVADGLYTYCAKWVSMYTKGGTDKQMGFDGWGLLKSHVHNIEEALAKAVARGKHVVQTSWLREPEYKDEKTLAGTSRVLVDHGRPLLPGEAKKYLPGQASAVLVLRSAVKRVTEGTKVVDKFVGTLQVLPSEEYIAGCRWPMGGQFVPADLRLFLKAMRGNVDHS